MTKNNSYDVIIVGGGVAGSTAGYLLRKLGFKTLIIDKAVFPRDKLCGGFVTLKTLQLDKKNYGEDIESLKKKKIINYITYDYEINYQNTDPVFRNTEYPFVFVNRAVYDDFLLQKAKYVGIEVLEGETIKSIDIDECKVILFDKKSDGTLNKKSKGREFKSDFLIGADGVNSRVRQEFWKKGLFNQKKWNRNLATAVEVYIDRKDLEKGSFLHPIFSVGVINWGFAWVFPNEERIIVGLGGLNRKNKGNFIKAIKNWISQLNLNSKPIKIQGHPVPFGFPKIKPVYNGRVFLIGDAGGFVCPLMGEGLYMAKRTAEFVVTAIYNNLVDKKAIEDSFLWSLEKYIYSEIKAAVKLRFLFFNIGKPFKYKLTRYLVKKIMLPFVELTHGERSFKWLRKKNVNLLELMTPK